MTQRERWRLACLLDDACKEFLKQSTQYRALRTAQNVVQQKRSQMFVLNHQQNVVEKVKRFKSKVA